MTYYKQSYCKDIQICKSLALMKDSLTENAGVVELQKILQSQIYLVRRYLFQTIGR